MGILLGGARHRRRRHRPVLRQPARAAITAPAQHLQGKMPRRRHLICCAPPAPVVAAIGAPACGMAAWRVIVAIAIGENRDGAAGARACCLRNEAAGSSVSYLSTHANDNIRALAARVDGSSLRALIITSCLCLYVWRVLGMRVA